MGLFSKKDITSKPIHIIYYEGDLPGFYINLPCQMVLDNSVLRITKINPEVTIKLDIDKVQSIDIFLKEDEYMLKYHGHSTSTSRARDVEKIYFTINYNKDGNTVYFGFWCTVIEISAIRKLSDNLPKNRMPVEITL